MTEGRGQLQVVWLVVGVLAWQYGMVTGKVPIMWPKGVGVSFVSSVGQGRVWGMVRVSGVQMVAALGVLLCVSHSIVEQLIHGK